MNLKPLNDSNIIKELMKQIQQLEQENENLKKQLEEESKNADKSMD